VNLKLNDPPGEIVPPPKELPVTVCGAEVVLFQITVVPAVMFRACGLNAKAPLLCVMIVTTTVGAGVWVGVGFGRVGVGVGLETVGVGVDRAGVGVGFGRVGVGVGDGAEGVFVVPTVVVLALVGAGVAVAVLLSPPHAVNVINSAAIKRPYQATRLDTYKFFSIQSASSRLVRRER
jgi:hypothetical protein